MARLKDSAVVAAAAEGMVPVELLSKDGETWREPAAFARWCARHALVPPDRLIGATWHERFVWASREWANANGLTLEQAWNLGVPFSGSLDRARARAEAAS